MKKLLLLVFLLILLSCKNKEYIPVKIDQSINNTTVETIFIDTSPYKVILTNNNVCYIIRISKNTGKTYKQYLGYKLPVTFKGNTVFTNKDETEYWYFIQDKYSFPRKKKIKFVS